MTMVSAERSTLNPNAPLFVPAAVRQVEDFSPEWWDLVTTSTWFHDYWLSQQQGEDGFFGNTQDDFDLSDIVDILPDSIYADEDTLTMESEYEQFLMSTELERKHTSFKQIPINGLELELKLRDRGLKSPVETARYFEKPAKPVSPKVRAQRIQQPR
ncbi:protein EARLY RESPONSIVE TO DEHYDRATION 15-like [Bidens hawaiensis]|uniref:protein EARLY RESPONSIVE TO DEHYDRATION 15-like n=1 Tax=Bidens hawaiensis TaxID=980011 RepID=UPI00404B8121